MFLVSASAGNAQIYWLEEVPEFFFLLIWSYKIWGASTFRQRDISSTHTSGLYCKFILTIVSEDRKWTLYYKIIMTIISA
jgi:hypothetical protein